MPNQCACAPPHRCACAAEKRARQVLATVIEQALDDLRVNHDAASAQARLERALGLAMRVLEVDGPAAPITAVQMGQRGGRVTLERHGRAHFSAAGKKGGRARAARAAKERARQEGGASA